MLCTTARMKYRQTPSSVRSAARLCLRMPAFGPSKTLARSEATQPGPSSERAQMPQGFHSQHYPEGRYCRQRRLGCKQSILGGQEENIHVGGQQDYGDQIQGDKVGGDKITTGDISGSTGIAIGRNSQATVTTGITGPEQRRAWPNCSTQSTAGLRSAPRTPTLTKKN